MNLPEWQVRETGVSGFIRVYRSEFGRSVWLGSRIRLDSPRRLTPMWPRIYRSHDEWCNSVLCLHLWPLLGVDAWWKATRRTRVDGPCAECRAAHRAEGACEMCGCRPCMCALLEDDDP